MTLLIIRLVKDYSMRKRDWTVLLFEQTNRREVNDLAWGMCYRTRILLCLYIIYHCSQIKKLMLMTKAALPTSISNQIGLHILDL